MWLGGDRFQTDLATRSKCWLFQWHGREVNSLRRPSFVSCRLDHLCFRHRFQPTSSHRIQVTHTRKLPCQQNTNGSFLEDRPYVRMQAWCMHTENTGTCTGTYEPTLLPARGARAHSVRRRVRLRSMHSPGPAAGRSLANLKLGDESASRSKISARPLTTV